MLVCLTGVWLAVWIALSWPAAQDDAFIHLRYAVNLQRYHMISYNGLMPDYGASSLFYVFLLAALRYLLPSPNLPRILSSVFHCLLFLVFARALWKQARALRFIWPLSATALFVLVTPSAVRWLDDGMETSLCLCIVTILVLVMRRLWPVWKSGPAWFACSFVLGVVAILTRVELLLILLVASLVDLIDWLSERNWIARTGFWRRTISPANIASIGGLTAVLLIRFRMHAFLPDTAIAKARGFGSWAGSVEMSKDAFLSAMSFGGGLLALWIISAAAVVAASKTDLRKTFLINSPFVAILLIAISRGQAIQGIRYLVWPLYFSILWNLLELWSHAAEVPAGTAPLSMSNLVLAVVTCVLVIALVISMPYESALFSRLFRVRANSVLEMERVPLFELRDLRATAYDVGFIGYFTESPICDVGGIVNGRNVARLNLAARILRCANSKPQYIFGNDDDLSDLSTRLDLSHWSICGEYDFRNLMNPAPHYIAVSPDEAKYVCKVTGHHMSSIAAHIHSPSKASKAQPSHE